MRPDEVADVKELLKVNQQINKCKILHEFEYVDTDKCNATSYTYKLSHTIRPMKILSINSPNNQ